MSFNSFRQYDSVAVMYAMNAIFIDLLTTRMKYTYDE